VKLFHPSGVCILLFISCARIISPLRGFNNLYKLYLILICPSKNKKSIRFEPKKRRNNHSKKNLLKTKDKHPKDPNANCQQQKSFSKFFLLQMLCKHIYLVDPISLNSMRKTNSFCYKFYMLYQWLYQSFWWSDVSLLGLVIHLVNSEKITKVTIMNHKNQMPTSHSSIFAHAYPRTTFSQAKEPKF
jgi:hypothetical protein